MRSAFYSKLIMEKSTPLHFYDLIKDFEFDYLNTLSEKAWKDLEKAYTCHLNIRKVQANSHKVACHAIFANMEKVKKISYHGQKLQQMIISSILMKEDEAIVNDNGRKRKLKNYESIRTPKNNIVILNDNEGNEQKEFALSIEISSEDINNILENIKANYKEKDELTDNDVERSHALFGDIITEKMVEEYIKDF
ncbi:9435_t:CDS:2 [Dentiscutata heterogama]|uniref:9435_t:CDS:1 n=1 Tax=Dentiscutata heterogama TaxID=1316150 RepID=A0ACA9JVA3_9GLOM|nr:9435_t:CDS:2 [Dentiscutata heterogama]